MRLLKGDIPRLGVEAPPLGESLHSEENDGQGTPFAPVA